MRSLSTLCIVGVFAAGCGRESPASPSIAPGSGGPPGATQISGNERIAWDQRAGSPTEFTGLSYFMYVDGERRSLNEVSCGGLNSELTATCRAQLPTLSAGSHALELTSVNAQGMESARSGSLQVVVVRSTSSVQTDAQSDVTPGAAAVTLGSGYLAPSGP